MKNDDTDIHMDVDRHTDVVTWTTYMKTSQDIYKDIHTDTVTGRTH